MSQMRGAQLLCSRAAPSLQISPLALIRNRSLFDNINEFLPLERVNGAYACMSSGKARFRVVITMEQ